MFAMFFNVVFAVFVCYPAAFCQLCFYNKDWIGLDWIEEIMTLVAFFVLTQYRRMTDRQTDRQTDGQTDTLRSL